MVDSSVKTISRPVINRHPVDVNQLDKLACGQLDRVCDFASNFVSFTLLPSQKYLIVFDSTWGKFIHTPFLYLEHFSSPCYIFSNPSCGCSAEIGVGTWGFEYGGECYGDSLDRAEAYVFPPFPIIFSLSFFTEYSIPDG